eukprot:1370168-Amorphochlora_amoeboformis.AAC.1
MMKQSSLLHIQPIGTSTHITRGTLYTHHLSYCFDLYLPVVRIMGIFSLTSPFPSLDFTQLGLSMAYKVSLPSSSSLLNLCDMYQGKDSSLALQKTIEGYHGP